MPTVAELKQQVGRIWIASFHSELADTLTQQLRQHALAGVRAALEAALSFELASYLASLRAAARTEGRSPSALPRSGSYQRQLLTSSGFIPDLRIPKLRSGNADRAWLILTRYQLTMQVVVDQALYLYTLGLSFRALQEALYLLFGQVLSRQALNRVRRAAQSPMEGWRQQPITDTPPILIVDGVWVQVLAPSGETWIERSGHQRQDMPGQERVVLTVMGVWEDARQQILHYQAVASEETESPSALLATLKQRGLDAEGVRMVGREGSSGLRSALAQELPLVQQQRCVVLRVPGLERSLSYRDLLRSEPSTQAALTFEAARKMRREQVTTGAQASLRPRHAPKRNSAWRAFRPTGASWRPRW